MQNVDLLVTPTMTQPAAAFEGYDPSSTARGRSFTRTVQRHRSAGNFRALRLYRERPAHRNAIRRQALRRAGCHPGSLHLPAARSPVRAAPADLGAKSGLRFVDEAMVGRAPLVACRHHYRPGGRADCHRRERRFDSLRCGRKKRCGCARNGSARCSGSGARGSGLGGFRAVRPDFQGPRPYRMICDARRCVNPFLGCCGKNRR